MSDFLEMPEDLQVLIDAYVSGVIDDVGLCQLEDRLRSDADARGHFVRYCRMHTDLQLEALAHQAGHRALRAIEQIQQIESRTGFQTRPNKPGDMAPLNGSGDPSYGKWPRKRLVRGRWLVAAAALLVAALGLWAWLWNKPESTERRAEIAWLVNAQDCQWADGQAPAGDMRAGKVLRLERGLAEIRFQVGAQVVLEGPANLELLTGNSARLVDGKLTAKVPAAAKGFQIISPHGKVVDLGTEFAMSVALDGTAEVYVYTGKVEAYADKAQTGKSAPVSVQEKQAARIDAAGVALTKAQAGLDAKQFVRAIVPLPRVIPRTFVLDFHKPVAGSLLDAGGQGVGLTHRLPGTGKKWLKAQDNFVEVLPDENLRLDSGNGQLVVKTTNSDLNKSYQLYWGEYLGVRLADHGFTGKEDFAVTVVVPNIPTLPRVGQFGLYAGRDSKKNIRGGMISEENKQFLVQNQNGKDIHFNHMGVSLPGSDVRLTLRRAGNSYSLTVENLTTGSSTTITAVQPEFLANENDIYLGFFGANTQSKEKRTLMLKEFKVTVWTVVAPAN